MTENKDLEALTLVALSVAREAAELVLKAWRSRPSFERKASYADLVTEHDLASERLIRRLLAERTPNLPIVGEEQGGTHSEGRTWYCDPIDGTVNFTHGHAFFAVSIGLLEHGKPVLGAVVAPALASEWHGYVGGGAFRNGNPCQVSPTDDLSDSLVATGFSPVLRRMGAPEDNLAAFARVMPAVRDIRRCGSAALDLCLVADGTYEAYWERKLSPWDMVGGAALVLAAGGRLTSLSGGPADLLRGYIVASNGHVHDGVVALVSQDGQSRLSD